MSIGLWNLLIFLSLNQFVCGQMSIIDLVSDSDSDESMSDHSTQSDKLKRWNEADITLKLIKPAKARDFVVIDGDEMEFERSEIDGALYDSVYMNKSSEFHFQSNPSFSEYSQFDENKVKGFSYNYVDDLEQQIPFLLKNDGVEALYSDNQIICWCNLYGSRDDGDIYDHCVLMIMDDRDIMFIDSQLMDGHHDRVVFASLRELSDYRKTSARHRSTDIRARSRTVKSHSFIDSLDTVTFFPLHQKHSIKSYHLRRICSDVWSNSPSRCNNSKWIEFRERHFPLLSLPQWIESNNNNLAVLNEF
eukprot:729943_1